MFQVGKTGNINSEFNRYKMDIVGLSEITGLGEPRTTSGAEEHHRGVGLILSRTNRECLIELLHGLMRPQGHREDK